MEMRREIIDHLTAFFFGERGGKRDFDFSCGNGIGALFRRLSGIPKYLAILDADQNLARERLFFRIVVCRTESLVSDRGARAIRRGGGRRASAGASDRFDATVIHAHETTPHRGWRQALGEPSARVHYRQGTQAMVKWTLSRGR